MIQLKSLKLAIGSALLIALSTTAAFAVDTDTTDTTITMDVPAVCLVSVNTPAISLAVIKATAAGGASAVSTAHDAATYSITNNNLAGATKVIEASIPVSSLPTGVSLKVTLAATANATSGTKTFTGATAQTGNVLTAIGNVSGTAAIAFELSADDSADETPASSPTVVVTLTMKAAA